MDAGLLGSAVELSWAAGEGCVIPYLGWLGLDRRFAGFVFFLNPFAVIVLQPLVGHLSDHGAGLGPALGSKIRLVIILGALTCLGFLIIVLSLRLGNALAALGADPASIAIGATFVGYFVMDVSNDLILIPARALCLGEATLSKTRRRRNARFTVLQCAGRVLGMGFGVLPWEEYLFGPTPTTDAQTESSSESSPLLLTPPPIPTTQVADPNAGSVLIAGHKNNSSASSSSSYLLTSAHANLACTDSECTHAQVMMSFAIVFLCTVVLILIVRRFCQYAALTGAEGSSTILSTAAYEPIPGAQTSTSSTTAAAAGTGAEAEGQVQIDCANSSNIAADVSDCESESDSSSEEEEESDDGEELGMVDSLKAVMQIAGHHPSFRRFFLVQFFGWCAIMYQAFFWTDWVRGTYTVLGSPMRLSFIGLALQAFLSLLTAMLLPRINRRVGPVLVYFVGQFIAMLGLMLALVTGPGPWSIVAALMMAPGYVTHTNNCYIVAFRALESPSTSPAGVGPAVRQQQQGYDTLGNGDGTTTNPTQPCVHENKGSVVAAVNMAMPAAQIVVGGLAGVALHAVGDDPGRVLFGIGLVGAIVNVCVGAVVVPNLSRRKPPHHHHHKSRASARRASA